MATTYDALKEFLTLSEELTGFSATELQGTGLVEPYYNVVRDIVGERSFGRLLLTWHELSPRTPTSIEKQLLDEPLIGPVARNTILLWYEGTWHQMPGSWRQTYGASAHDRTHVVSAKGYQEGLMWRAIAAHPPTAKAPGFASWTEPPAETNQRS